MKGILKNKNRMEMHTVGDNKKILYTLYKRKKPTRPVKEFTVVSQFGCKCLEKCEEMDIFVGQFITRITPGAKEITNIYTHNNFKQVQRVFNQIKTKCKKCEKDRIKGLSK